LAWPPLRLAATIGALTALRVVVAALAPLTDDEAYYRLWALAPAMSYFDHPPMTAWMIAAGIWIAGDNALGIRLAAPMTSLLGPFILWRAGSILFDRTVAERATWLALAMPLLAVGGVIITPDTPSVLFWGLAVWAIAELHVSRNGTWWLAIGLFCGLGLLSKYTNLFVGAGIGLWLVCSPTAWRWLRSWQLWSSGALACALALPVLIWNAQHEWSSFARQFGRVASGGEPATMRFILELVGAYLGLASPVIAVLSAWGVWIVLRCAIRSRNPQELILAVMISPFMLYCFVHAVHARVQPNWPAPLYPMLALCAAITLCSIARKQVRQRLEWGAIAVGFVLSGLIYAHTLHPIVYGPGIRDPTSQMRGWAELAAEVEELQRVHGAAWIATSSYATTGQLAFRLKFGPPVVQLNERIRYAHLPPVDDRIIHNPAIYIELERNLVMDLLKDRFASITHLGILTRRYQDNALDRYVIYRVADPIGPILRPDR
jgi:4-amino-4-deoxy-L-arabinose transferase-like glycosyltransferase